MRRLTRLHLFCLLASAFVVTACGEEENNPNTPGAAEANSAMIPDGKLDTASVSGDTPIGIFAVKTEIECANPCTLSVNSTIDLHRVAYEADGWALGESMEKTTGFAISYTFNNTGQREIKALGYDASDRLMVEAIKVITITPSQLDEPEPNGQTPSQETPVGDMPYFNQYDNQLHPGATCQNTSISMVLASLGWNGRPDDITRRFGKDLAQSPAGLAQVFNRFSDEHQLSRRLKPITDGTLLGLKSELDKGLPVIVHGYFTRSGHVVVILGYDDGGYYVNDPAGRWLEGFKAGYSGGSGENIYYKKAPFEAAIATSNGSSPLPLWYHALR